MQPLHADVPGMDIHVNEIVLTHQSKLETIRTHVSRDNTLLTVRDFIVVLKVGLQTGPPFQLLYSLTGHTKMNLVIIIWYYCKG